MRIAAALLLLLQAQDTKPEDLPSIRTVQGDVRIWRVGKSESEAVKKESKVGYGDRIGTLNGDYACLHIVEGDGVVVSVKGVKVAKDRGLALERAGSALLIKVYDGRVTVESLKAEIQLETPQGTVKAKQAYFYVEVSGETTKVVSLDGPLTFATSLGTVTLESGQESTAGKDKKPTDPKPGDTRAARELEGPANLVANPGFELELKHWNFQFGNPDRKYATIDNAIVNSGARSVSFEISPKVFGTVRNGGLALQRVTVTPGKRYLCRAYVRLRTVKGTVNVGLSTSPVEEGTERNTVWNFPKLAEEKWTMVRSVVTAREAHMDVSLCVQIRADDYEARAWLDDVSVVELPAK